MPFNEVTLSSVSMQSILTVTVLVTSRRSLGRCSKASIGLVGKVERPVLYQTHNLDSGYLSKPSVTASQGQICHKGILYIFIIV